MDSALAIVQLYEANFPELLRKVFVVNGKFKLFNYFHFIFSQSNGHHAAQNVKKLIICF